MSFASYRFLVLYIMSFSPSLCMCSYHKSKFNSWKNHKRNRAKHFCHFLYAVKFCLSLSFLYFILICFFEDFLLYFRLLNAVNYYYFGVMRRNVKFWLKPLEKYLKFTTIIQLNALEMTGSKNNLKFNELIQFIQLDLHIYNGNDKYNIYIVSSTTYSC